MLRRQRSLDMSWCGRGFSEWVGCHIWGRPGWWKMAAVMMREEPVSGRQGQAPLLFLPPRSKCHLCESAATWPQGTVLPDASLPPSWSKSQTPSWPLHLQWTFLGLDFMVSGSAGPSSGLFSYAECSQDFEKNNEGIGAAPGCITEPLSWHFPSHCWALTMCGSLCWRHNMHHLIYPQKNALRWLCAPRNYTDKAEEAGLKSWAVCCVTLPYKQRL